MKGDNEITFKEKENIICDLEAKELIAQAERKIAFLLLLSFYYMKLQSEKVLNITNNIYKKVALQEVVPSLDKRLKINNYS